MSDRKHKSRESIVEDVHYIAERFLRDYLAEIDPQPLAEAVEVVHHVNIVRLVDGQYYQGTRLGRNYWTPNHRLAVRIPSHQREGYEIAHSATAVWASH